jgi:hypothetical protein
LLSESERSEQGQGAGELEGSSHEEGGGVDCRLLG